MWPLKASPWRRQGLPQGLLWLVIYLRNQSDSSGKVKVIVLQGLAELVLVVMVATILKALRVWKMTRPKYHA